MNKVAKCIFTRGRSSLFSKVHLMVITNLITFYLETQIAEKVPIREKASGQDQGARESLKVSFLALLGIYSAI